MDDSSIWILHLSDLHLSEESAWDADRILRDLGGVVANLRENGQCPDFIAVTGDLANKGRVADYVEVRKWIESVLKLLGNSFDRRHLLLVPGNHDVNREKVKPSVQAFQASLLESDQDKIAKALQDPNECELLLRRHEEYLAFVAEIRGETPITAPWWSNEFNIRGHRIHFVGLCSSWMSYLDDKGKLIVGNWQAYSQESKLRSPDLAVALVHHPFSYLTDNDAEALETVVRRSFHLLLRGHLHSPRAECHRTMDEGYIEVAAGALYAGSSWPNAFNLIEFQPPKNLVRIHTWLWSHGRWNVDYSFGVSGLPYIDFSVTGKLQPTTSLRLDLPSSAAVSADSARVDGMSGATPALDSIAAESAAIQLDSQPALFTALPDLAAARAKLEAVPTYAPRLTPQHAAVRQTEQATAEAALRCHRQVSIVCDWGLGKDGFIATCLSRFKEAGQYAHAFRLDCDDVSSVSQLLDAAVRQWGMSLQEFCLYSSLLPFSVIVLDSVSSDLVTQQAQEGQTTSFPLLLKSLLDYCPRLHVILHSRRPLAALPVESVVLRPLDAGEVRVFAESHPRFDRSLQDADVLEILFQRSGGVPMHLDRMIESLQVTSLDALDEFLEADELSSLTAHEPIPRDLIRVVHDLHSSEDKYTRRSLMLLKALSVLAHGETLERVRKLYPNEPTYPRNAMELIDLSLIDAVAIGPPTPRLQSKTRASGSSWDPPRGPNATKLLVVPRQVRDYVFVMLHTKWHSQQVR
jgi:calcineurin-like phosphoesterase family protein